MLFPKLEVDPALVANVIFSACSSSYGIRSWATRITFDEKSLHLTLLEFDVSPLEPKAKWVVPGVSGAWERALAQMARIAPVQFGNLLSGRGDAETGNVLVQCAVFGELKYG